MAFESKEDFGTSFPLYLSTPPSPFDPKLEFMKFAANPLEFFLMEAIIMPPDFNLKIIEKAR